MNRKKGNDENALRRRAEESLHGEKPEVRLPRTEAEAQRLIHELQVHQIELEMQNEELRGAQRDAEEHRQRYQDLYDFAPVGYVTLNARGAVAEANLAAASLLGCERHRLVGLPLFIFLAPASQEEYDTFLRRLLAGVSGASCEVRLGANARRQGWLLLDGGTFVAGEARQPGRLALMDITDRKMAGEQIEKLNADLAARAAELESANRELEAFNYSVSHDLRIPLTVVGGFCEILEKAAGSLDEQCRGYLREIGEGVHRMGRLIDTLLNFSRLGRVEPRRETVDLTAMANDFAAALQLADPERPVTFRIADRVTAKGDPKLLMVALQNLFGNAWKYTGSREEAVIEFGAVEMRSAECGVRSENLSSSEFRVPHSELVTAFFVRDNGIGFDMADADRMFTPFQRLPGTDEYAGYGIGLATVRRIVQRHGGRIWAEGTPGEGATIWFTLP